MSDQEQKASLSARARARARAELDALDPGATAGVATAFCTERRGGLLCSAPSGHLGLHMAFVVVLRCGVERLECVLWGTL